MFKSFQTKMILLFTLLFIAGQVVILGSVYFFTHSYIVNQAKNTLVQGSKVFEQHMSERLERLKTEASYLSTNQLFQQYLQKHQYQNVQHLLALAANQMRYEHYMLFDKQGNDVANSFSVASHSQQDYQRVFQQLNNSKNEHMVVIDQVLYEFVLIPVSLGQDVQGSVDYWLATGIPITNKTLQAMKKRYTFNVDIIIRQKTQQTQWSEVVSSIPLSQDANALASQFEQTYAEYPITTVINDNKYLVLPLHANTPPGNVNFQILLLYDYSQVLSIIHYLVAVLCIIFIIGLVITVIFTWLISRRITRPVRVLSKAAKRVIKGHYDVHIDLKGNDEISHLSYVFSKMLESIKLRETTIFYQSMHDHNTQLPNRNYFRYQLSMLLNDDDVLKQRMALLFIEVARIKEINNTLGHKLGLLLKVQVAERLKNIHGVEFLAHFSSDEFVMVIKNYKNKKALIKKLTEISTALEQPFQVEQANVDINSYIGVCEITKESKDPDLWLRHADHAHYVALQSSQRYCFYDESLDQRSTEKLSLMGELVEAIKADQLEVFYQPKIGLQQSEIVHAEALIRWHHPKYGYLCPEYFISLAEQTGHIQKLTYWIIPRIIQDLETIIQIEPHVKISINLSARDLNDTNIISLIKQQLNEHNIAPEHIILEITESAVMQNMNHSLEILKQFRQIGLLLSIDDFGTQYSTMTYLKQLPVDDLKIDQSFICHLEYDRQDAIIVKTLISLAHQLGLTVTAEGVATADIAKILTGYGCDYGQGYYFKKPMNLTNLIEWLQSRR